MSEPYKFMKIIHDKATNNFGGFLTWRFTQSNAAYGHITGDGICLALTNYWILYHALDDHLANYVGGYNTSVMRVAPIQVDILRFMAFEQGRMKNLTNPYQKTWWRQNNLKELGHGRGDLSVAAITSSLEHINGAYALIALTHSQERGRPGHAISAYVGGGNEGALVFDPNFGEFWFNDRHKCYEFLRYLFYTYYFSQLGLNQYEFKRFWRKD